jgi:hypothetical protein
MSKSRKQKKIRNKTSKNSRNGTRGGTAKVTEEEIANCNNFYDTSYLINYEKAFKNDYKTNPYLKNLKKSEKEIQDTFLEKKPGLVNDCKRNYCGKDCSSYGNKKLRYVCPVCEKKSSKAKKMGAITFCRYDEFL